MRYLSLTLANILGFVSRCKSCSQTSPHRELCTPRGFLSKDIVNIDINIVLVCFLTLSHIVAESGLMSFPA